MKRKKLNEILCLFCDATRILTSEPKFPAILKTADTWKDEVGGKFKIQYNTDPFNTGFHGTDFFCKLNYWRKNQAA